jgi:ribosomal protein L24E
MESAQRSFTDRKRRIATERDVNARWSGDLPGVRFRCGLCGHRFKIGDGWRWVYGDGRTFTTENGKKCGVCNFLTCDACDTPDVLDKWVARYEEFASPRFWALR